jgi:hypothetical protein
LRALAAAEVDAAQVGLFRLLVAPDAMALRDVRDPASDRSTMPLVRGGIGGVGRCLMPSAAQSGPSGGKRRLPRGATATISCGGADVACLCKEIRMKPPRPNLAQSTLP